MKKLLSLTLFCFLFANIAVAQSSEEEEEPFKNDPFFNKKIEDFFDKSSKDESSEKYSNGNDLELKYINNHGIDLGGILEAGPYKSNALYSVYPNMPMIHFNRVDALFLGIRKERMQWYDSDWFLDIPNIRTHGLIGYSFGQDEFQYSLGLEKYFGHNDRVIVGGEYHSATTTDDYWRIGLTENSFTSFFGGYDYLDYYKQEGWGAYILFRTARLFEGGVAYSNDRFNSLQQKTDWALFGAGSRYRLNPPIEFAGTSTVDTLNIASLTFSAAFNPKRLVLSRNFTFSASGSLELGDPGLASSDYSYNKYLGELITYVNFEPGGVLKHRLKMGAITGDAPYFKEFQLGGVGSLRALPYKSLGSGNQMILSNTELQFGSPSWETNNDWIDFDDFFLSLFLDSGWTSFDPNLVATSNPLDGFSNFSFSKLNHNAGVGVGSNSIRFELAWDLNNTSRAPVFWVRFNPTF
ncbi:MAG: hypothetical protein U5J95_01680 [Balneolaceae bacterium]|nr:hypothetical protein [Balneolaceae bacterium]